MSNTIELEPCYLLHSRKYTDSKNIISILSRNSGILSAVIRIKKIKNIQQSPSFFTLLNINYFGKNSLKTVTSWEFDSTPVVLENTALFCGLYINELLTRVLHEGEETKHIFSLYEQVVDELAKTQSSKDLLEICLRNFEFGLLKELGFELDLLSDSDGFEIENSNDFWYLYREHESFWKLDSLDSKRYDAVSVFCGEELCSIREKIWTKKSLAAAKRLARLSLSPLLGGEPLRSKELFKSRE